MSNPMNIDDYNQRLETLETIKDRFNLVILVSVFFPTLISALLQLSGNQEKITDYFLTWSAPAGLYILSYFLFELRKKRVSVEFLEWISNFLLAGVGLFVIPIFVITTEYKGVLNYLIQKLFYYSLCAIPIFASVLLILIIASIFNFWIKNPKS